MRTKEEILKHLGDIYQDIPDAQERALVARGLLIEVLIDIRDMLATNVKTALQMLWDTLETKGGGE